MSFRGERNDSCELFLSLRLPVFLFLDKILILFIPFRKILYGIAFKDDQDFIFAEQKCFESIAGLIV